MYLGRVGDGDGFAWRSCSLNKRIQSQKKKFTKVEASNFTTQHGESTLYLLPATLYDHLSLRATGGTPDDQHLARLLLIGLKEVGCLRQQGGRQDS